MPSENPNLVNQPEVQDHGLENRIDVNLPAELLEEEDLKELIADRLNKLGPDVVNLFSQVDLVHSEDSDEVVSVVISGQDIKPALKLDAGLFTNGLPSAVIKTKVLDALAAAGIEPELVEKKLEELEKEGIQFVIEADLYEEKFNKKVLTARQKLLDSKPELFKGFDYINITSDNEGAEGVWVVKDGKLKTNVLIINADLFKGVGNLLTEKFALRRLLNRIEQVRTEEDEKQLISAEVDPIFTPAITNLNQSLEGRKVKFSNSKTGEVKDWLLRDARSGEVKLRMVNNMADALRIVQREMPSNFEVPWVSISEIKVGDKYSFSERSYVIEDVYEDGSDEEYVDQYSYEFEIRLDDLENKTPDEVAKLIIETLTDKESDAQRASEKNAALERMRVGGTLKLEIDKIKSDIAESNITLVEPDETKHYYIHEMKDRLEAYKTLQEVLAKTTTDFPGIVKSCSIVEGRRVDYRKDTEELLIGEESLAGEGKLAAADLEKKVEAALAETKKNITEKRVSEIKERHSEVVARLKEQNTRLLDGRSFKTLGKELDEFLGTEILGMSTEQKEATLRSLNAFLLEFAKACNTDKETQSAYDGIDIIEVTEGDTVVFSGNPPRIEIPLRVLGDPGKIKETANILAAEFKNDPEFKELKSAGKSREKLFSLIDKLHKEYGYFPGLKRRELSKEEELKLAQKLEVVDAAIDKALAVRPDLKGKIKFTAFSASEDAGYVFGYLDLGDSVFPGVLTEGSKDALVEKISQVILEGAEDPETADSKVEKKDRKAEIHEFMEIIAEGFNGNNLDTEGQFNLDQDTSIEFKNLPEEERAKMLEKLANAINELKDSDNSKLQKRLLHIREVKLTNNQAMGVTKEGAAGNETYRVAIPFLFLKSNRFTKDVIKTRLKNSIENA